MKPGAEQLQEIWNFVEEIHAENPEMLEMFKDEMSRSTKPERSWIAGFGYPFMQSWTHFFYLSSISICGKHRDYGTLWKNIEPIDRVCGDCMDAVFYLIESKKEPK